MSEAAKTVAFVVVGAVFLGVAWVARPVEPSRTQFDDAGERFFEQFDPLEATRLEIVEFDEQTGRPDVFQVAQVEGLWSLPSRDNYPADGEDQLAGAAAAIVDLVKSPKVADRPADHELYGVLDPNTAPVGASGVGTRVTLQDAEDRILADLIIGKEVRGQTQMRYVRSPAHDRVYTAELSLDSFSTRFSDWIERDLLKLDPADIRRVVINDYSIDEVAGQLIQRDILVLNWNPEDRGWSLEGLSDDQELVPSDVNTMKWALDDLDIVDVFRKPAGLSEGLRAEEALQLDAEAVGSLRSRGYLVHEGRLISNEGELTIATVNGVVYKLRFGEIALGSGDGDEGEDAGANRYLFVTAQFDPNMISPPELDEVPDFDIEEAGANLDEEAREKIRQAQEQARTRIEQANADAQAEYDRKMEEGRAKVTELNDRFADWYYVIPDSVYQKLRLTRADIVKDADPPDGEG